VPVSPAFGQDFLGEPARRDRTGQDRTGPDRAGWFRLGPCIVGAPVLNFQPVPEAKAGKARIHLDLWVGDLRQSIEIVERLGGTPADEVQERERVGIAAVTDPEGNEFCLIAGPST
jgi:hypothetical protein